MFIRNPGEIKEKIEWLASEYYQKKSTIPGRELIKCAAMSYNYKEIMSLVSASLDFWLVQGKFTKQFETLLADYIGVKHAVFCNSGSSANLLAISALTSPLLKDRRLNPGDEVITCPSTFPTSVTPIWQNGLVPIFIDVNLTDLNIEYSSLELACSKRTKAIMVCHTLGIPAEMDIIMEFAKRKKLWVIEDNCDALGSLYRCNKTGSIGDMSTCSFYPAHHISTGEGGAVCTNNPLLRKIVLSFRDWGRDCWCLPGVDDSCGRRHNQQFGDLPRGYDHKYTYSHAGYNLKATDLQAAIGVEQIKKIHGFVETRRYNYEQLLAHLCKYRQLKLFPFSSHTLPSPFGFPMLYKNRRKLVDFLESKKIATRMLFGGNLTRQPAFKNLKFHKVGDLKNADRVMKELLWIGVHPLIEEEHLEYMKGAFDEYFNGRRK